MFPQLMFLLQVWYCTSSRAHTTVAKYAEYIATSFKEAKERLSDKFSINPTVSAWRGQFFKIRTVLELKLLYPADRNECWSRDWEAQPPHYQVRN